MNMLLKTQLLNKTYQTGQCNEHSVLKDINLTIQQGDSVAIMGPSGSGKSTLLHTISGMDRMTSGRVVFEGQALSGLSESALAALRLHRMGFIFQDIHLLKNLSVFDNVVLPAYHASRLSRKTINERADALLEQVGIAQLRDHDITQASGGQLQRVGICRALINNPAVVFGDEPTGALNSAATGEIMALLADFNRRGTTMVLATHDIKVASRMDRVVFMRDGQIVADKLLGKNTEQWQGGKAREEQLANWLLELGF